METTPCGLEDIHKESEIGRHHLLLKACSWGHCCHGQRKRLEKGVGTANHSCGLLANPHPLPHSPATFGQDVHLIWMGDAQISQSRVMPGGLPALFCLIFLQLKVAKGRDW